MSTISGFIRRAFSPIALFSLAVFHIEPARADWPQILGPTRDGVSPSTTKLAATWPVDGPRLFWSARVGAGYAGPAIRDSELFLFQRVDDEDRFTRFAVKTGAATPLGAFKTAYRSDIAPDNGPRCV